MYTVYELSRNYQLRSKTFFALDHMHKENLLNLWHFWTSLNFFLYTHAPLTFNLDTWHSATSIELYCLSCPIFNKSFNTLPLNTYCRLITFDQQYSLQLYGIHFYIYRYLQNYVLVSSRFSFSLAGGEQ